MNRSLRFILILVASMLYQNIYAQTNFYWKSVSAAEDYTVAIRYDGTLWAWGRNNHGQLGDGTTVDKNVPTQIGTLTDWVQVSAKGGHTVAVTKNGYLYAWGKNDYGQLGDGTTTERHISTRIGTATWKAAYAGDGFTIGISLNNSNTIWGWGNNDKAQLGNDPSNLPSSLVPVQIIGPRKNIIKEIYTYPTWYDVGVGKDYFVGICYDINTAYPVALPTDPEDKNIVVWGNNLYGQLGTGNLDRVDEPLIITELDIVTDPTREIKKFEKITTGNHHTMALKRDGSLWAWGNNTHGELGVDPNVASSYNEPTQLFSTDVWIDIMAGENFSVGIKSDGTLWTWGANDKGQLGNGVTGTGSWQPVQEASLSTNWDKVSAGDKFVFGIKKDGSMWAWGDNEYGQLGIGNQINQNEPVLIATFGQPISYLEKVAGISFPGLVQGSMVWGDYNNDGYLDVFISGSAKTTSTANTAELWENNGNNTFTKVETAVFTPVSRSSATWLDYDNDGLLDIFVTGSSGANRGGAVSKLYRNKGDGTFQEIITPIPGIYNNSVKPVAVWADFNNDGFIDVVVSGGTVASADAAKLYKNNGNGVFEEISKPVFSPTEANPNNTIALPTATNSTYIWVDYDGDGYKDLVIEGKGGTGSITRLYRNNGNETFTEVSSQKAPFLNVENSGITWGDYNNDGYPDVIIAGKIAGVEYTELYKNNGDGSFSRLSNTGLKGVDSPGVILIDMDGDGLQDIVAGGNIGNSTSSMAVYFFKNNGDDTFTEVATPISHVKNTDITYADFNNDGRPDLLIGGHNNTEGTTALYKNVNTATVILPQEAVNLSSEQIERTIKFTWNKPTTVSGTPRYNLRVGSVSGANDIVSGLNQILVMVPNNTQPFYILNTQLEEEKTYYYAVQTVDAAGNKSEWSAEASFTVQTLPVSLVAFEALAENNRVKLTWTTVSEKNSDRFEVIRISPEGKQQVVANVISKGESNEKIVYTAYDNNPLVGLNYYRLKQYDNDGTASDFGIKSVRFDLDAAEKVTVYPNPVTNNEINLVFQSFDASNANVSISDINGRTLHNQVIPINGNKGKINPVQQLLPGYYVLQVTGWNSVHNIKLLVK